MKMISALLLAGALAAPVTAQDNSAVESNITAMENAWIQAYKSRDGNALGEMLHDSMLMVNDDGSIESKQSFMNKIDQTKRSENQQDEPKSITVKVFGNVAIAAGVFRQQGVRNGKAFVRRDRFVDTWIRSGGSWECVAATATPILQ